MSDRSISELIKVSASEVSETSVDFVAKTIVCHPYLDACTAWIDAVGEVSVRDRFELFFSISGERKTTDGSSVSLDEVGRFIREFGDEVEVEIKLHIKKEVVDCKLSIYSIEHYSDFVEGQSLGDFLASMSALFDEYLCFEVFSDIPVFGSKAILFRSASSLSEFKCIPSADDVLRRREQLLLFKENCLVSCLSFPFNNLTPGDFYLGCDTDFPALEKKFKSACSVLALMFLANNTECVSGGLFSYKFYGYKAVDCQYFGSGDLVVDFDFIYQIYDWAYDGGNVSDKLGLVRNIVSIHLDEQGRPKFDKQLKDAIWSNCQIYLKGNVQSYLEVKNKIGELLVDFIGRTASISDDLLASLKSNVAIVVTFLLTVVVVNGLKDNGESVVFSNIYLGVVFIITAVSWLWLGFLKKNILVRFDSAAKSIEATILANYGRVLLLDEIKESVGPAISENRSSIINEITSYSRLWQVLLFAFLVLYFIGNAIYVEKSAFFVFSDYVVRVVEYLCATDINTPKR